MTCRGVQSRISAYLDRELTGHEMLAVRAHLETCAACQREAEAERELKRMLGAAPAVEPPAFLEERLLAAIEREALPARRGWGPWAYASVAGLAMVATLVALQVQRAAQPAQDISFEVQRDQMQMAGSDPMTGTFILPTSDYAQR